MDYFSEDDGDFLVMEFIPGYDLAELLELRGNPFPQAQVMRWADELLKALGISARPTAANSSSRHQALESEAHQTRRDILARLRPGQRLSRTDVDANDQRQRSSAIHRLCAAGTNSRSGHGPPQRSLQLRRNALSFLTGVPPTAAPTRFSAIEDEQPDPLRPIEELNPLCLR